MEFGIVRNKVCGGWQQQCSRSSGLSQPAPQHIVAIHELGETPCPGSAVHPLGACGTASPSAAVRSARSRFWKAGSRTPRNARASPWSSATASRASHSAECRSHGPGCCFRRRGRRRTARSSSNWRNAPSSRRHRARVVGDRYRRTATCWKSDGRQAAGT